MGGERGDWASERSTPYNDHIRKGLKLGFPSQG